MDETAKCTLNGKTCLEYPEDGPYCCDGRDDDDRPCIPCDETNLKKPPGSAYTLAGTCEYGNIYKSRLAVNLF